MRPSFDTTLSHLTSDGKSLPSPYSRPAMDGETMAKKKFPVPDAAWLVSAWALLTAGVFPASFALAHHHVPCDLCVQPTDITWMMYCAATQAAAAAPALLLPGRHRQVRRALACIALALALVVHFFILAVAADSDHIVGIYWTVFFGVGDFVSSLALLFGGED